MLPHLPLAFFQLIIVVLKLTDTPIRMLFVLFLDIVILFYGIFLPLSVLKKEAQSSPLL